MSAFVDTNVLIRLLTGDPSAQADRVTEFLRCTEPLLLADLIVAETIYVLESVNRVARPEIARMARAIVSSDRMLVADRDRRRIEP